MDHIELQKQMGDYIEDVQLYESGISEWESEMKKNEELLKMSKNKRETIDERVLNHKEADDHKQRGNDYVQLGKWKEAIEQYSASISLYPDDAAYYGNRSYCHMNLKNWKAAESDCDKALELKADYKKVALRRAQIRKNRGNYQGAAEDYNFVLISDPKNQTALKEFEELYPELKNYFNELGISLPDFYEMNPSLKSVHDEELKVTIPDSKISNENHPQPNITSEITIKEVKQNSDLYLVIQPESYRPPHLRSKLPLRRIKIEDIYSMMDDDLAFF